MATARLTPEGATCVRQTLMRMHALRQRNYSPGTFRLQVAAESLWICQFDEDQASGGKLNNKTLRGEVKVQSCDWCVADSRAKASSLA